MTDTKQDQSWHRLPEPVPLDLDAPFVGNETRDDNLAESVQVALWTAAKGDSRTVDAAVFGGNVMLTGHVDSEATARRCEARIKAIMGVRSVNNLLSWNALGEPLPRPASSSRGQEK